MPVFRVLQSTARWKNPSSGWSGGPLGKGRFSNGYMYLLPAWYCEGTVIITYMHMQKEEKSSVSKQKRRAGEKGKESKGQKGLRGLKP